MRYLFFATLFSWNTRQIHNNTFCSYFTKEHNSYQFMEMEWKWNWTLMTWLINGKLSVTRVNKDMIFFSKKEKNMIRSWCKLQTLILRKSIENFERVIKDVRLQHPKCTFLQKEQNKSTKFCRKSWKGKSTNTRKTS